MRHVQGPGQLDVSVTEDQLIVSGEGTRGGDLARSLHRGLAARRFQRACRFAPGRDVVGADFDRGLPTTAPAQSSDGCAGDRAGRSVAFRPATRLGTGPGHT